MKQLKIFCDRCRNEIKTRMKRIIIQDYVEIEQNVRFDREPYKTHVFKNAIKMELCDECYEKLLAFMNLQGGDIIGEPTKQL